MICPKCGFNDSSITDSRPKYNPVYSRRRRYKCNLCDARWTTIEVMEKDKNLVCDDSDNGNIEKVYNILESAKRLLIPDRYNDLILEEEVEEKDDTTDKCNDLVLKEKGFLKKITRKDKEEKKQEKKDNKSKVLSAHEMALLLAEED